MLYLNSIGETFSDYPDSESIAVIVSFYGCTFNCKGCQNPSLQKKEKEFALDENTVFSKIRTQCDRSNTDKIVLSGGDPYCMDNKDDLSDMINLISDLQNHGYNVCVYTGSTIDAIENLYKDHSSTPPLYLKCGTYQEESREKSFGKDSSRFVLVTKNQAFYRSFSEDNRIYHFKKISQDNTLFFGDNK